MHSYEARVISINKVDTPCYLDYLLDPDNHITDCGVPCIDRGDYVTIVICSADYERMMKHFDADFVTHAEVAAGTTKIIKSLTAQITSLKTEVALINSLNTMLLETK